MSQIELLMHRHPTLLASVVLLAVGPLVWWLTGDMSPLL